MPGHLRAIARDYSLEDWVDRYCQLETYYETVHMLAERLKTSHKKHNEDDPPEQILVNLVAQFLLADGALEDYVIENPLSGYDDKDPAVLSSIHEATAILVIRRYDRAVKNGDWEPSPGGGEGKT